MWRWAVKDIAAVKRCTRFEYVPSEVEFLPFPDQSCKMSRNCVTCCQLLPQLIIFGDIYTTSMNMCKMKWVVLTRNGRKHSALATSTQNQSLFVKKQHFICKSNNQVWSQSPLLRSKLRWASPYELASGQWSLTAFCFLLCCKLFVKPKIQLDHKAPWWDQSKPL